MFTLFRLELRYHIKRLHYLINIYVFYLISSFILLLNMKSLDALAFSGILWILLIFISLLSPILRWDEELGNGYIEQWKLTPLAMETVVISRLMAHILAMLAPLVLLTLALDQMLPESEQGAGMAKGFAMLAVGTCIASIVQFTAALARDAGRAAGMMGILAMPLIIPAILFASNDQAAASGDAAILLLGYVGFVVPISILATAASLRAAN